MFALFGRAAFDPVVGAKVAPKAAMGEALEDRPVPVTTQDLGQLGVRRQMSAQVCFKAARRPEPVVSRAVMGLQVRPLRHGRISHANRTRGVHSSDWLHVRQLA